MENVKEFLSYRPKEGSIHLPNEIFQDLQQSKIESPKHIAFAYSYYYLINYLYRYSKYGVKRYTQSDLKAILGYSRVNKDIDYIIKKNGVLDKIGYTTSVQDYPIEDWQDVDKTPVFTMYSEFKKENFDELKAIGLHNDRHYFVKYPVKAFYRTKEAKKAKIMDGTFYQCEHTHGIPTSEFLLCMSNEKIGTIGFYLYGYLKYKIDYYKGCFAQGVESIAKEIGLSKNTVLKYKDVLEENKLIFVTHATYILNNKQQNIANIYMKPMKK